ncbi:unnamed protein product, partial [Sphacelaria rigidula]
RRYGGADHLIICAWWNCRGTFDASLHMRLARVMVGINEAEPDWARWGCKHRLVTVPYTSSSSTTTADKIGGLPLKDRTVLFFFAGTDRGRRERLNLKVLKKTFPETSVIELGHHESAWSEDGSSYSENMSRSRFCFCPRGDTRSSRRMFDAVAAGCIPVLTA